jgi:hypothetical protein
VAYPLAGLAGTRLTLARIYDRIRSAVVATAAIALRGQWCQTGYSTKRSVLLPQEGVMIGEDGQLEDWPQTDPERVIHEEVWAGSVTADAVDIRESTVERVQADTAEIEQSWINHLNADEVRVMQGGILSTEARLVECRKVVLEWPKLKA